MAKTRLGYAYRDIITGFCGTATGKVTYITGCTQTLLVPSIKEGDTAMPEGSWLDDDRLVEVSINVNVRDAFILGADLQVPGEEPVREMRGRMATGPGKPPPIK